MSGTCSLACSSASPNSSLTPHAVPRVTSSARAVRADVTRPRVNAVCSRGLSDLRRSADAPPMIEMMNDGRSSFQNLVRMRVIRTGDESCARRTYCACRGLLATELSFTPTNCSVPHSAGSSPPASVKSRGTTERCDL